MTIRFLYFDLGRVLLDFTHEQGYRQIARVAGCDAQRVQEVLVDEGLGDRYERGELSTLDFHQAFCSATASHVACDDLSLAWGDIFQIMPATVRLAASLRDAGYRMGILSNTCEAHWLYAAERFRVLGQLFDPVITSYQEKSMKPDTMIYRRAAERADVAPENLFFVDDRLENVRGAEQQGWTAVQFHSALQLANELEQRGLEFNR